MILICRNISARDNLLVNFLFTGNGPREYIKIKEIISELMKTYEQIDNFGSPTMISVEYDEDFICCLIYHIMFKYKIAVLVGSEYVYETEYSRERSNEILWLVKEHFEIERLVQIRNRNLFRKLEEK